MNDRVISFEDHISYFQDLGMADSAHFNRCATWRSPTLDRGFDLSEIEKILGVAGKPWRELDLDHKQVAQYCGDQFRLEIVYDDDHYKVALYCQDLTAWREKIRPALQDFDDDHMASATEAQVKIVFSYQSPHGGIETPSRNLECPAWESVRENYRDPESLDKLMNMEKPYRRGKLVLWHGVPGNGKTYAIRALARQWSDVANIFYVIDPEILLSSPSYLHDLLLDQVKPRKIVRGRRLRNLRNFRCEEDRFNVIILEDALSFILEENRARMGPQMSRLLNLTEGFIGQGLRLVIVLTTNEELKRIDPAFTRPGRILQIREFKSFSRDAAWRWCRSKGVELPEKDMNATYTLAELYGQEVGTDLVLGEKREALGFASAGKEN